MDSRFLPGAALLAALLMTAAPGCQGEGPDTELTTPELETEEQKVLYSLGTQIASLAQEFRLTEEELPTVQRGFVDQTLGKKMAVEPNEYADKIGALRASRMAEAASAERRLSEAWVEEAAKEENAVRYDEGFVITTFAEGTGEPLADVEFLRARWKAKLRTGKLVESSAGLGNRDAGIIGLSQSIRCWALAVPKMRLAGKYKLRCPPDLVHGDAGLPPRIPGGAAVEYDIDVRKIMLRSSDLTPPTPEVDPEKGENP